MMRRWLSTHSAPVGNAAEMAHFSALAKSWWDPNGPQRILHKMNLMRMDFIRETLIENRRGAPGYSRKLMPIEPEAPTDLGQIRALDIGCGGGLLCESLARSSFVKSVRGIDVTPQVIAVAREHQALDPSVKNIDYSVQSVDATDAAEGTYDLVTMFEVLEHVDNPSHSIEKALSLVNPNGWLFLSTINRTVASYLSTIFMGEFVLKIVPKGTHTWSKYINEDEIRQYIVNNHAKTWQIARTQGCVYVPTQGWLRFDPTSEGLAEKALNLAIGQNGGNYLMALYKNK